MEWRNPIEIEEENSLCHFGVKGMRWRHHKSIATTINDALNTKNGSNAGLDAAKPKTATNAGLNAAGLPSSEFLKEKEYNSRKNESLNAQRLKNQDEEEQKKSTPSKNLIEQTVEFCSNVIKNVGNTLMSAISSLFKH